MDASVQVAIVGGLSSAAAGFLATLGLIVVAFINSRKERHDSAESGVEAVLRERLAYKDEQIEDLEQDKAQLLQDKALLIAQNEELRASRHHD